MNKETILDASLTRRQALGALAGVVLAPSVIRNIDLHVATVNQSHHQPEEPTHARHTEQKVTVTEGSYTNTPEDLIKATKDVAEMLGIQSEYDAEDGYEKLDMDLTMGEHRINIRYTSFSDLEYSRQIMVMIDPYNERFLRESFTYSESENGFVLQRRHSLDVSSDLYDMYQYYNEEVFNKLDGPLHAFDIPTIADAIYDAGRNGENSTFWEDTLKDSLHVEERVAIIQKAITPDLVEADMKRWMEYNVDRIRFGLEPIADITATRVLQDLAIMEKITPSPIPLSSYPTVPPHDSYIPYIPESMKNYSILNYHGETTVESIHFVQSISPIVFPIIDVMQGVARELFHNDITELTSDDAIEMLTPPVRELVAQIPSHVVFEV